MSTAERDTPPSSDIEPSAHLPPSPPQSPSQRSPPKPSTHRRTPLRPVERLFGTLRLRWRGRLHTESTWLVFKLSSVEYEEFEERLRKEPDFYAWYQHKVNYDWDSAEGEYVLRMPNSALHERFIRRAEDAIRHAIREYADRLEESVGEDAAADAEIAAELRKTYKGGSTTIHFNVPKLVSIGPESEDNDVPAVKRSPDASFYHPSQEDYPSLVIEVSYSQPQKKIPRLADSYIVDSSHAICAVVGFDLPYLGPAARASSKKRKAPERAATYTIWRPDIEHHENEDGTKLPVGVCAQHEHQRFWSPFDSNDASVLELRLRDILPESVRSKLKIPALRADSMISVPLKRMVELLNATEAPETILAANETRSSRPKIFRKRKRTPSEELSDSREESFLLQEMREQQRDAEVGGEYVERPRRVRRKGAVEDDDGQVQQEVRRRSSRPRRSTSRGDG